MARISNQHYITTIIELAQEHDASWSIDQSLSMCCEVKLCFQQPIGEFYQDKVYDLRECYAQIKKHIKLFRAASSKDGEAVAKLSKLVDELEIIVQSDFSWTRKYRSVFSAEVIKTIAEVRISNLGERELMRYKGLVKSHRMGLADYMRILASTCIEIEDSSDKVRGE